MIHRLFLVVVCALTLLSQKAFATGVGVSFGQPHEVALSLKSANSSKSYAFAASWKNNGLYLHGDYLLSTFVLSRNVPLYAGIGARANISDNNSNLGIRIPFGMAVFFSKLEIFFEIVPTLMLAPEMDFITDPSQSYGIGARYHFNF
ncbi:hypothetical protein QA601_08690 [Chitinispirillales bacterium ANBcel5]|uniref:hypothetical protein n=1 Tax=Cellulosispirillum alkaliphilum TaxID=3039283 RepID=UPI002A4F29E5|nr:hypothetical protein [Chitinispirillales bacterium ANBcel5]